MGFWLLVLAMFAVAARAEVNVPTDESSKGVYDPLATSEMDDLASDADIAAFAGALPTGWTLFVEDRAHSIRKTSGLPKRWLTHLADHTGTFTGTAQPGEFYVFQVGVFAAKADTGPLDVRFENLPGARCFNLGGTDYLGKPFTRQVSVKHGELQALWIGIDVPKTAGNRRQPPPGLGERGPAAAGQASPIHGRIIVTSTGVSQIINVVLSVSGKVLDDHGDRDSWRLSRLRWLDSTIGLDDNVVTRPFTPIVRDAGTLKILGRELHIGSDGLPQQILSFFNEDNTRIVKQPKRLLLSAPIQFVVETDTGILRFRPRSLTFTRTLRGAVNWSAVSHAGAIDLTVQGLLEYDGFSDFQCQLRSSAPVKVKDIRLEVDIAPGADGYFMGLGSAGGKCPESVDWKWNSDVNQDGFWIGAVNGGFKLQLYGDNWRTPLINCYYHFRELKIPESWGTGGIRLTRSPGGSRATAYTGPREIAAGKPLDFNFKLFTTPFKPLNTDAQWSERYYHPHQGMNDPIFYQCERVREMGANLVNIHHNQDPNPTINYPYFDLSMPLLKQAVASGHANGVKVKIYYTTRELTNNLPELFAFWSLNGEIICPGPGKNARPVTNSGGPHPWLIEHLGETGYIPAWREVLHGRYNNMLDLAVITTPDSRLDNFYCQGLAFTLRETGFDGMYIDDTSMGRKGFQRAHRIFEAAGKPLLVDMHSWNHNNNLAGSTPSAYVFMQNFPYYHRLWFGEGHNCNIPPDEMLVQQSGIPFGLMGEMLDSPNPWHGMVFGETTRLGWSGDPRPLWKFWDEFGMAGSAMHGWWNPACPVQTNDPSVFASAYRKPGKTLIALASWAPGKTHPKLTIDWKALGLDPKKTTLWAPAIEGFQPEAVFAADGPIPLAPGRGWLLVADEAPREVTGGPAPLDPLKGLTVKATDSTPFEIAVPANTVRTEDIPWPAGATAVVAHVNPMDDEGQSWGIGLAAGWKDGQYVQVNARTDGRYGTRHNGAEELPGTLKSGTPATLVIKLTGKTAQLLAKSDGEDEWETLGEFPRTGDPLTVRIGKIGTKWTPQDYDDKGSTHPCRVDWVRFYE